MMTTNQQAIEQIHAGFADPNAIVHHITFVDTFLGDQRRTLGQCVVRAASAREALERATSNGCYLGGNNVVTVGMIGDDVPAEYLDRLLTDEEVEGLMKKP